MTAGDRNTENIQASFLPFFLFLYTVIRHLFCRCEFLEEIMITPYFALEERHRLRLSSILDFALKVFDESKC
ncbi:hypothetical protein BDV29DRAFT_171416 [Aspergillus leporis]|uniref:Uncharacterized protein n=1 Tax=Aspergillus leporis TaxID=41062 RepID=A0A5N5X898_9EURO|nr:hypothetical protein BDV29DRAFT_171416 [Aspergillus leporis]